jgi:uncharacterized small protein (DUF1192 family)
MAGQFAPARAILQRELDRTGASFRSVTTGRAAAPAAF